VRTGGEAGWGGLVASWADSRLGWHGETRLDRRPAPDSVRRGLREGLLYKKTIGEGHLSGWRRGARKDASGWSGEGRSGGDQQDAATEILTEMDVAAAAVALSVEVREMLRLHQGRNAGSRGSTRASSLYVGDSATLPRQECGHFTTSAKTLLEDL
jgi:hypothetical protein